MYRNNIQALVKHDRNKATVLYELWLIQVPVTSLQGMLEDLCTSGRVFKNQGPKSLFWSSFRWLTQQMEIETLHIQTDHWALQLRSPRLQTVPWRRSCWQRSSSLLTWIVARTHSSSLGVREMSNKNPRVVPSPITSCSCRSSSRWRTSFSAAATTFLRFCRKVCSSAHRSNPRRASRFLGLKHRPWVLRPGHKCDIITSRG